ncbi:hypothetical protein I5I57_11540 [Pseudomonas aeruginosa]|nr:hypothetical protein Y31_3006 [Pseudomonas aeruginosa]MBG6487901.1 hypothetical protein [Pseudomonas aeruginosa]MCO4011293.1 hypothetical protein [Pseudomonas aeruginosa]PNP71839.1 hypothetical protein AL481_026935 [Pseudomonas aeruginosa]HBM65161.1 hypothetical protein [Pseudomonas sp.]
MSDITFSIDWLSSDGDSPAFRDTSGHLAIHLDAFCLTRNEDVWSRTVRDKVLVSAYPLALWLASSWWRLNFEPLPRMGTKPPLDWRMAHELGAANHGYVWPRVIFAPDGEIVNVWAEPIRLDGQSIQYLYGLETPSAVKLDNFQRKIAGFVESVLSRLDALGHGRTDLAELWSFIREDSENPEVMRLRILEAQMGYDPEECPQDIIAKALSLQRETGLSAMSELAPVFGRRDRDDTGLEGIISLASQNGILGRPQVSAEDIQLASFSGAPWQRGVDAARKLRAKLGNTDEPIKNAVLFDLLGITEGQVSSWESPDRNIVAVAKPVKTGELNYLPRKKHPLSRRFEFARMIGEVLDQPRGNDNWLVSTDIATAKQKRQRAFAAELLCPIHSLTDYLNGDYSESSLEDAAEYFNVSDKIVESSLANYGYLDISSAEPKVPYRSVA